MILTMDNDHGASFKPAANSDPHSALSLLNSFPFFSTRVARPVGSGNGGELGQRQDPSKGIPPGFRSYEVQHPVSARNTYVRNNFERITLVVGRSNKINVSPLPGNGTTLPRSPGFVRV